MTTTHNQRSSPADSDRAGAPRKPKALRSLPRATYRLQLHHEFGFREATLALPYLAALGISHVYCSPYLRATPGSMHGYDVVDPCVINPDLGSAADFDRFNRELRALGLAQLLDIVPNHMGVESAENAWWQDVLRSGEASPYANRFDIDWSGVNGVAPGRLLLPILGAPLAEVIAQGQLQLRHDESEYAFRLHYFDRSLPINARGTALIFGTAADQATDEADPAGEPGDPLAAVLAGPELLAAVIECQHYELAPWQDAATRINYRRFFDVSGLGALRLEDPAVFEATHRLVIELVQAGIVSGLRVDHPDGLQDPAEYFRRLQKAIAAEDGHPKPAPLYIVAEKILAEGEALPADWPVSGTTGYDFANLACGVLLDVDTAGRIDEIWREFTGETAPRFADMALAAKKEVLARSFGSEMKTLTRGFQAMLPASLQDERATQACADVLAETIACFPVYRTYPAAKAPDHTRRYVREACEAARSRLAASRSNDGADTGPHDAMLEKLEETLLGPTGEWALRFQQLCAPVMAKGVEDTALYRWTRLVSINDVGADPDVAGVPVGHFHQANAERRANWPNAMLATSTHDNKRGEYVRMRINLISEQPDRWREIALDWREQADRLMKQAGMTRKPSASDLYLLFQTFVGTFPVDPAMPEARPDEDALAVYAERLKTYMTKACREAKVGTSWTEPDESYEGAVHQLIDLMLTDPACQAGIAEVSRPFAWYGALNSLSITTLKLTVPGVPDIYQGANVLDDSLVDPDNRRPVDFAQRQTLITELAALAERPGDEVRQAVAGWLAAGAQDKLKLWTIHRVLGWRKRHPEVFDAGAYIPVQVKGALARHCIAYARCSDSLGVLVLVSRLYRQAGFPGPGGAAIDGGPAGVATASGSSLSMEWGDTSVDLSGAGIRAGAMIDLLLNSSEASGGVRNASPQPDGSGSLRLDQMLKTLPVAVLIFDVHPRTAG